MEVLKRAIVKIGASDWSALLEKVRRRTDEAVMKH